MNSNILRVRGRRKDQINDERWTIKDKVHQYKGILKLHGRNQKFKDIDASRVQKQVSNKLKLINSEVKEYRGILNEVRCGDKRRMRQVLQNHRDLQLAYENHNPGIVYDAIYQDCDLRRRQLDKLYYLKRKKMKEFFDLKLETAVILNKLEEQNRVREPDHQQQKVALLHQKLIADKNAAETIRTTYQTMLNILEKDTTYFTAIINALRSDRIEQCKVLMKTTYVGQLAAEDLDDTRQRYEKMSSDVLKNMKERECTLKIIRTRVDNLGSDIKLLVRVESDTKYMHRMKKQKITVEEDLEKQMKSLENTFERVKDTLLARSCDELLSRFEEQAKQKKRLMEHFKINLAERDAFMNKKNSAELILADLEHSMLTTTGQYKTDKKEKLEQIEEEKRRELDFIKIKKSRGELLISIKAALQNLLAIMVCVKPNWSANKKSGKAKEKRRRTDIKNDKRRYSIPSDSYTDEKCQFEKVDSDACIMLEEVTKKATILLGLSNYEITLEDEEKAKNLYQNYVAEYRSNHYRNRLKSEIKLNVDHEVIDPTIYSRADIKAQSKHIVETNTRND